MHYCMSDIHGEYDRFVEMLKLIQFTEDDYLFVIGDTIDRFRDGVRVLRHIMAEPNMFLIKGNHEKLLYDDIGPVYNYQAKELWLMNGGSRTRRDLMYRCTSRRGMISCVISSGRRRWYHLPSHPQMDFPRTGFCSYMGILHRMRKHVFGSALHRIWRISYRA